MIAAWMLYSVVLGGRVVVAATPVERLVRELGGATRRVWTVAIVGALLLPVVGVLLKDSAAAVEVGNDLVVDSPATGPADAQLKLGVPFVVLEVHQHSPINRSVRRSLSCAGSPRTFAHPRARRK